MFCGQTEPQQDRAIATLVTRHAAVNLWSDITHDDDCDSFLAIAVRSGLYGYIELKIEEQSAKSAWLHQMRVLHHALKSGISLSNDSGLEFCWKYEIDLTMLRLTLELGASPSSKSRGSGATVWLEFLQDCLLVRSKNRTIAWDMGKFLNAHRKTDPPLSNTLEACELLLEHGAGIRSEYFWDLEGFEIIKECFTDVELRRLENQYRTAKIRYDARRAKSKKHSMWQKLWNIF